MYLNNHKNVIVTTLLVSVILTLIPTLIYADEDNAYQHLTEVMDKYHRAFDIYTDRDAGGNHFTQQQWYNGNHNMEVDLDWCDNPHSGYSCIRVQWNGQPGDDGWLWNGVMWREDAPGLNLNGAERLTFWGRTNEPGLNVIFIIHPPGEGEIRQTYRLEEDWTAYEIDLVNHNLEGLCEGFGFSFNSALDPNPDGTTFYLDDIQFDLERLEEPRFLLSYEALIIDEDEDGINDDREWAFNQAYTYDNAIAMLAFLARENDDDLRRARIIGDAFAYAQENDRFFNDGRLRNAYRSGDIDEDGNVRLPGWWDDTEDRWFEDDYQVSSHTGPLAWVIIAWLTYDQATGEDRYLDSALRLGEWIRENCWDGNGDFPGYTGGFEGNDDEAVAVSWKSTEHNIDIYVAFTRLSQVIRDGDWDDRANEAGNFIELMWDENDSHFWTGTTENDEINEFSPLDVQTWAQLAFQNNNHLEAIGWAQENCFIELDDWSGFHYCSIEDIEEDAGIWWEGTAQMCCAFQILNEFDNSNQFLDELCHWQIGASIANNLGIAACYPDRIFTGIVRPFGEWYYFQRLHIGATAWYIFAERRYNPYWHNYTVQPPPQIIVESLAARYFELVSTYLMPPERNAAEVFGNIHDLVIVYQNDGGIFLPPDLNTIGNIDITQGYQIFCSDTSSWVSTGEPIDLNTTYHIRANTWNWLGYPFDVEIPVEVALSSIEDIIRIVITDDGRFWIPGLVNTLGNMRPGEGYMVFADQEAEFQYSGR